MSRSNLLFAILVLFSISLAPAQEATAEEPRPETSTEQPAALPDPLPPVPPVRPTTSPTDTEAEDPDVVHRERSVYVPYQDLQKLFEDEGRGVFLPYKEFLDLWNQLTLEKDREEPEPPTDGVVSSAVYKATAEGTDDQVLAIDALLRVESFKDDGWAVVPLAKSGLAIAESETGDATLHLGKNGYELILPRKGQYEITLKLYAKIQQSSGRNQVAIHLPKAGVSKFEATLPGREWEFEIEPGAAFSSQPAEGDNTLLSFFFGETEMFDLVWQKQGGESTLQPLLFVETDHSARIVPGAIQSEVDLHYNILRAGVSTLTVEVPTDEEVLNVAGENIKQWNISATDDKQVLTVDLHAAAKDDYTLTLTLEKPVGSLPAEVSLPQIEALEVVRQRGNVTLHASRFLEVETVSLDGLVQRTLSVEGEEDTPGEELRPLGRFRYLDLPYEFAVSVEEAAPLIEVQSWTRFQVDLDFTEFTTRFDYEIKRVGIFETRIQIPEGFEGLEATGEAVEDFSVETDPDGTGFLSIKFQSRTEGTTSFSVTGRQTRESTEAEAIVPVFEPQGVARHEGRVGVEIHTSLDPQTTTEGDLRQQDVSGIASDLPGEGQVQIGFRYRGEAAPATLAFTARQPQVSGEVLALVEVREQVVRYEWTVAYRILYAGVESFVIAIPEDIAADLRHDGTLIKEVDKNYALPDGDAVEGEVLWNVILREKRMGDYQVTLTLERPITNAEEESPEDSEDPYEDTSFTVALPKIRLVNVQTETGQIAVVKDDNLEILNSETSSLEPIDPLELRSELARPGVFLSYKYRRHPLALNLEIGRNEFLPVPQAVVTYASLVSVVSGDKAITSEVVYWVKNNAKQFLSVSLPEAGSMVSDIYVDGKPQQPMSRSGEDVILVRLPVGEGRAEKEFPVRFVFEVPSPNPGKGLGWSGSLEVPPAELLDAEILQSRLQLYLPDDHVYRGFDSAMNLPLGERGWTRFRNAFDWLVPTLGPRISSSTPTQWQEPPSLPDSGSGGFDLEIPTEGRLFTLHRLDRPDSVKVGYRGAGFALFWEAVLALVAFVGGLFLIPSPFRSKLICFAGAGLLPLVIAGAVAPGSASFWTAIYLGTFLAAVIWILRKIPAFFRRVSGRLKQIFRRKPKPEKKAANPDPEPESEETEESKS